MWRIFWKIKTYNWSWWVDRQTPLWWVDPLKPLMNNKVYWKMSDRFFLRSGCYLLFCYFSIRVFARSYHRYRCEMSRVWTDLKIFIFVTRFMQAIDPSPVRYLSITMIQSGHFIILSIGKFRVVSFVIASNSVVRHIVVCGGRGVRWGGGSYTTDLVALRRARSPWRSPSPRGSPYPYKPCILRIVTQWCNVSIASWAKPMSNLIP